MSPLSEPLSPMSPPADLHVAHIGKDKGVVYDLSNWTLGYAHVSHALRVLTKWEHRHEISTVMVSSFSKNLPKEMQYGFIQIVSTGRPALHIKVDATHHEAKSGGHGRGHHND